MIDRLLEELQAAAPFVMHIWERQPAHDYGTIQIASERMKWSNNVPRIRQYTLTVNLFTYGGGEDAAAKVEQVLNTNANMRRWVKGNTEYVDGANLIRHTWTVTIEGLIRWPRF